MYSEKVYPNYLSGYGYFMSTNVALKLYEESFNIPLVHMEDVFFTGKSLFIIHFQTAEGNVTNEINYSVVTRNSQIGLVLSLQKIVAFDEVSLYYR